MSEDRQVFAVLPPHPLPALSFARLLQKQEPLLKIDFVVAHSPQPAVTLPHQAVPLLTDYALERQLKQLDLTYTPPKKTLSTKRVKTSKIRTSKAPSPKRPVFLLLSIIFFLLALPFILTIGTALTGGLLLKQTGSLAEKRVAR